MASDWIRTALWRTRRPIHIACSRGLAPLLAAELTALGMPVDEGGDFGVSVTGTLADTVRLNLHLRTASRVLFELARERVRTPEQMQALVTALPWEHVIAANGYLSVQSSVRTLAVRDPRFATLACKDAIVDRIRQHKGRRPDTGNEREGVNVNLYWVDAECRVYLDTTGETLSRRGYRVHRTDAPMPETLAAGMLLAAGWAPGCGSLVNPMCGSGTLAIEGAMMAAGMAPGLMREGFAFSRILGFDGGLWTACVRQARQAVKAPAGRILATDHNPRALDAARANAVRAGVGDWIEFRRCDFAETEVPPGAGVVVVNPEYGRRMGEATLLEDTYRRLGDFFKQRCAGYTGWIITGNLELADRIGLRPFRKLTVVNGDIECRLMGFRLYAGSVRARKRLSTPDAPVG